MTVSDRLASALLALLTGDSTAFDELTSSANGDELEPLGALTAMAFLAAVRAQFTGGWSDADVIRFVARVRTEDGFDDLSPSLAEALLATALGNQPLRDGFGEADKAYAQLVLLQVLARDMSRSKLDALLGAAREQADAWLQQQAGNSGSSNTQHRR